MPEVQGQRQDLDGAGRLTGGAGQLPTNRCRAVHGRLAVLYGQPISRSIGDPLDELVATILSQHTSDTNSGRAFARLQTLFPTWEDVLAADEVELVEAIRPGGLARVKAPRIRALLERLRASHGSLSLDFLHGLPTAEARSYLESFPGVGPKTAACVLLFSLGRPVVPVDTHVLRVSRRIGLASPDATAEEVEQMLESRLPPDACLAFHVNLIAHGRQTCRARVPLCPECCLADLCDYRAGHPDDP